MIDEHHPMQIGMFPMDMKCQQQQHQQQQQQQHQQQQHPQNGSLNQLLLLNGNERMLTTPTPTAATVTDITTVATAATTTTAVAAATATGNKPGASHNDKMASISRNVNGSCNNLNSNTNSNTKTHAHQQHQQQQHSMPMTMPGQGPGPPSAPNHTQLCSRITLGECSLNGMSNFTAPAPPLATTNSTPQAPQILQQHTAMAMGAGVGVSVGVGGVGAPLNQCSYCCQPICDRYIMRVVDNSFHESCLKCTACSLHLVHSCYAKDGKLFCRIDYERLYIRNRCLGCGHKIAHDELVMRCHENVFHLKCFACVVCGSLLKKGEQYVVKQGQLFCRFDYEKEVEMLQGYDFYSDDIFPPKMDGRRGPKRPRTILNTQQRRAFKASFEVSPKPCRKVRENLAKETGLSLRIVQVWFQNQRAKVKKIQKKAKQEPPSKGASDSQDSQESQDSSLATKIKDEAHSDSESPMESSPYSATSDGLARLRCTIKDEQEQVPFNCMETNKENCNKNNEPILNTILGLSYATFQQLMGPFTQTPMINPIDRLYSMQSSYFRPEELGAYGECGGGKEPMD
ncbi:uncharacterized protein Dwil_GK12807 [Drosophila willistoni]|uniref:LIM homeobox transcription factor 1-beta n=1 Tax=Drosophila willistoni TaxID=7260 RepID=B4N3J3_DROWI|nr:LIM homeobox transcription factor 1-beta [Drosophila willistoni]EDW79198.2 uncharacterized protein Dwil_GK12807 [Drosophila willistoni]